MDFIFRLHQTAFDPSDEREITKNWEWIKEAISFASAPLYHAIEHKEYQELNNNLQLKIYKYLLRARYRCTPFGLWAGVGLGTWDKESSTKINLEANPIPDGKNGRSYSSDLFATTFKLAPSLSISKQHIFFWAYSDKDEGWAKSYAERNKLIDLLLAYFRKNKHICYLEFKGFIQSSNERAIQTLWEKVITIGILCSSPVNIISKSMAKPQHVNLKLKQEICLSESIRKQLEFLPLEIGALFVKFESSYLNKFMKWFINAYDDRFINLTQLFQDKHFNPVLFLSTVFESQKQERVTGNLWGCQESIDLKAQFPIKKTRDIYQLQFAYKLDSDETIMLENIACNRLFAYAGRYSKDKGIYSYLSENLNPAFESTEVLYADLTLFESKKSNFITDHQNLFQYSISLTDEGDGKSILGMEDLWIGIKSERIIVYSEQHRKQVIPVVQHPLNPNHISHPIARILWEAAHQDNYKFLPYHHAAFQDSDYVPRLYWGEIVLQARRWRIYSRDIVSKKVLYDILIKKVLPDNVLAGYQDREMLLNWKKELDMNILFEEIKSQEYCDLYECLWKDNSPFSNSNSAPVYPQFIYSWTKLRLEKPRTLTLNRMKVENNAWVYFRLKISEFSLIPFFERSFAEIIQQIKSAFNVKKWYYLVYRLPEPEIRLRICLDDPKKSTELFSLLAQLVNESGIVGSINTAPYYPEFDKYGFESMSVSESIFSMESEFIIGVSCQETSHNDWGTCTGHVESISELFCTLIISLPDPSVLLAHLRVIIKNIDPSQLKSIKQDWKNIGTAEIEASFEQKYLELFHSHTYFADKEKRLDFLSNHLHMFCNRSFPVNTLQHEQEVLYVLYKKLGRRIFKAEV